MLSAALFTLALRFGLILLLYAVLLIVLYVVWRNLGRGSSLPPVLRGDRLLVVDGGATGLVAGDVLPLLLITSLGRSPDSTIYLDDPSVAEHHALLRYRDGQWWLEDLGSSTGTWLNRQPVTTVTPVSYGDTIILGQVRLRIERG